MSLLAQVAGGFAIAHWIIVIIAIAAAIGILIVITRVMGVTVPPWIIQIAWILLAAVVGITAIRFLFSL